MPPLGPRHILRQTTIKATTTTSTRQFSSSILRSTPASSKRLSPLQARLSSLSQTPPPFPVIPTCPSPTCCSVAAPPTPPLPSTHPIDTTTPIANGIPAYDHHIVVATGVSDWASRIEDSGSTSAGSEDGWKGLVSGVKNVFGRKGVVRSERDGGGQGWGKFVSDVKNAFGRKGVFHSGTGGGGVLVTAGSVPVGNRSGRGNEEGDGEVRRLLHFPSWREYTLPPPPLPPPSTTSSSPSNSNKLDPDLYALLAYLTSASPPASPPTSLPSTINSTPITTPTILICTHASRDLRCGVLGPVLLSTFESTLAALMPSTQHTHITQTSEQQPEQLQQQPTVAGISHIGGHKFAGNVIVYLPPGWPLLDPPSSPSDASPSTAPINTKSPLAGHAIWYGRVEPKHVEGVVRETVMRGRVIRELGRGVVDYNIDSDNSGDVMVAAARARPGPRLVRI